MQKTTLPKDERMNELLKQDEMTVAEAAEVLGLSRQTVYRLIDENALVVSRRKTATMGVFVSTASILKFMRDVQLRHVPAKVR
jgi:DNA-binding XRE family transcriptional regulator